jgi:hypothetical protein
MSGSSHRDERCVCQGMPGFPSLGGDDDDGLFDDYETFDPDHIPEPNVFLEDHDVLTGEAHLEFHELTREVFEERKVYDMTFNYNLARLNLDTRHKNAGYRYAEEAGDDSVLRAEFTPTTPFCPQTHTLTKASFRAWNGLRDRHDYDLVKVRSDPMHHDADAVNEELEALEATFVETGEVDTDASTDEDGDVGSNPMERAMREEDSSRGSQAPF